ncbi:MAG: spondin domain-containing protein [Pseudomonadota bacterium]
MKSSLKSAVAIAVAGALAVSSQAEAGGATKIPSVVIKVENSAPSRGSFLTPIWFGLHDGTFDLYNRGEPLGAEGTVPAPAVERIAEDGAIGPLNEAFAAAQPYGQQGIFFAPTGPFAPSDVSAITIQVDPQFDRYFSYASMVLPSNDAFIANGNALAHEIFDDRGRFVAQNFAVAGTEVLDAGTEFNDEVAGNTAFVAQAAPDTGVPENGVVLLHPGFRTDLAYPDGIINRPVLGNANFLADGYRVATVKFEFVDLGGRVRFRANLNAHQEASAELVESRGRGRADIVSNNAESLDINVSYRRLTGPLVAAHLHLGGEGSNGPVVADLSAAIDGSGRLNTTISAADIVGPLAGDTDAVLALLNELAAGNVYVNLHTEANPAGEIRGQVDLR